MGKELEDVEALASKIVNSYFQDSDVEFLIRTFSDDIIWMGAGEEQRLRGKEAVAQAFRKGREEMQLFDVSEETYETVELGGGCYLCESASVVQTKAGAKRTLKLRQRATFIFKESGEGLEVVHLHNSVPYSAIQDGEIFPVKTVRHAYQAMAEELRTREREMASQAQFLTQLYNSVPCGILQFTLGPEYRVININRTGWEFYGYESEEEYIKENANPISQVSDEDRDLVRWAVDSLELNGEVGQYTRESQLKNGEQVFINVVMGRIINADGLEVIQAVFTDVTEMKRLQIAQEREQLLENHSLRTAVCTVYPLILNLNLTQDTYKCFTEDHIFDYIQKEGVYSELVEQFVEVVYPSYREDWKALFRREEIIKRFSEGEKESYMELQEKGRDGEYHWVSVQIIHVENSFNKDVMAIIMLRLLDAQRSEKARQEQLLRDALESANAASRAKSDFLSRMSHDIRTPMNAIIGMSSIGQLKSDDISGMQECFRKIDTSSKFLLSLINDILDMSKIESGKMVINKERFEFAAVIEEVTQIIYPQTVERFQDFEVYPHGSLGRYYIGDALRLKQILMNLLSNALKFTLPKGKIEIHIREKEQKKGYAYLEFIVKDSGIGISEEFQERLFQPFEQETSESARNYVGSGLGLAIVYNLTQLMGGTIQVHSQKQEGTEFCFVLPFGQMEQEIEEVWERKQRSYLQNRRILVVDDDFTVGQQAIEMLNHMGAHTTWADCGYKGVEVTQKAVDSNQAPDIVIIDWKMPDMDGVDTARHVRQLVGENTTVIMISAYDWGDIEKEAVKAGVNGFIRKPFLKGNICSLLTEISEEKQEQQKKKDHLVYAGRRVLMVEDNELNREIAKTLFEMIGMVVDTAENGEQALAIVQQSEKGYYMAVFMDIRMPVMDGLESTRRIRELDRADTKTLPILAMTANAFEEDKQKALRAGMNGYIVKPIDMEVVLEELSEIIR